MMTDENLIVFVEKQSKVGKDDPQLLPAVWVLELALEVSTQLVLLIHTQLTRFTNMIRVIIVRKLWHTNSHSSRVLNFYHWMS